MFRILLTVVGAFIALLGFVLLIAPELYLSLYIEDPTNGGFAARRLSPAIVGLGALLMLVAKLPKGPFPARFAMLTSLVWFGIAGTGLFDFLTGTAGANILLAAASEVILGALFLVAARGHRAP